MAALIGGVTAHSWGKIPINLTDALEKAYATKGAEDIDEMFLQCQSLRFLLIDEISALAALVFGLLESSTRRVSRRSLYARRADGTWRPFGGLNNFSAGDWWQLPPVRAVGFCNNPFKGGYEGPEQQALGCLWSPGIDSLNGMTELTEGITV